ncbi:hypothetical protein O6H91_20G056900 [Diphasiastrum complanatum]|uniref:Uncharacterized protein n=1 Tax=Diphasiastrum complanatum TaxID=34168 RepID=A0ACC2AQP5_DIPCM|nr:hypothetical protein O6H91_20G056900 [Diphasiastrum complanatum]
MAMAMAMAMAVPFSSSLRAAPQPRLSTSFRSSPSSLGSCCCSCFSRQRHRSSQPKRLRAGRRFSPVSALYVDDDEDYLVDAPISKGDGFSFTGGKYSDEKDPSDEWFAKGKMVNAYQVQATPGTAKEPIFGLAMGEASQTLEDTFSVAATWSSFSGFGFSDKPQVDLGFKYTRTEYAEALKSVVEALNIERTAIVVQGYFAPAVVQFASTNQDKVSQLILINPPLTEKHTKLPSALSCFSTFLLGDIFAQDPLRASDKPLTDCGPYILDEEDAMVYRRPYLSSGAAGFSLTAITRALARELKDSVTFLRKTLASNEWSRPTYILWGTKDRWLEISGVEESASTMNIEVLSLSEVGHHAQEDYGEEVGLIVHKLLKKFVYA